MKQFSSEITIYSTCNTLIFNIVLLISISPETNCFYAEGGEKKVN